MEIACNKSGVTDIETKLISKHYSKHFNYFRFIDKILDKAHGPHVKRKQRRIF